ncbi:MAG: FecR family protein [Pseudomonadales bacterium]|nr:FecR family protein [Pseudomonadales bacterium]
MKRLINQVKVLSIIPFLLFISSALFVSSAWANVGLALYTIGNVTVEKPTVAILRRGDVVEQGDEIVTGPRGYAQLKLADGTKIAIRPNSRFVVEALEAPATASTPAIGAGKVLLARFNLKKGGFRTITGRISKLEPAAYQLTTPSAIVGVRGTLFSARVCSADCGGDDDGVYVGVSDGGVSMTNDGGSLDLAKNQFGFAASFTLPPTRLIAPPSALSEDGLILVEEESEEESDDSDDSDSGGDESAEEGSDDGESTDSDGSDGDGSDGDSSDGDSEGDSASTDSESESIAEERSGDVSSEAASAASTDTETVAIATVEEPEQEISGAGSDGQEIDLGSGGSEVIVATRALAATGDEIVGTGNADALLVKVNENGNLIGFPRDGANESGFSDFTSTIDIGTGAIKNAGFDAVSQLRWGRWADGIADETFSDGETDIIDLNESPIHWVLAPEVDATSQRPALAISGTANYVLVGNTDPTDNLGHVGVLGSASLSADFTNNAVASSLNLSVNNQLWSAVGTGTTNPTDPANSNLFSGLYGTVSVDGESGGFGEFAGIFTGIGEGGVPVGAGLSYTLTNETNSSFDNNINGVVIFNLVDPL